VAGCGDLTRALREVTGCTKTYVMMFAEAEGFSHLHVHVVPRMPGWIHEQTGPRSMNAFLGRPPDECVPAETMDRLAMQVATFVAAPQSGGAT
jgi:diadenosine tetraphosphate (Ap4A) HIT family hydrolase